MKRLISYCKVCDKVKPRDDMCISSNGYLKGKLCKACRTKQLIEYRLNRKRVGRYGNYKKEDTCSKCGFTGEAYQLDVNHIDGNHRNNKITNLETVCANCHRHITYTEKHGIFKPGNNPNITDV